MEIIINHNIFIYIDFTYVAASNTANEDVINYVIQNI